MREPAANLHDGITDQTSYAAECERRGWLDEAQRARDVRWEWWDTLIQRDLCERSS